MRKNQYLVWGTLILSFGLAVLSKPEPAAATGVTINYGSALTQSRKVELNFSGIWAPRQMMIGNDVEFTRSYWEPYQQSKTWYLTYGKGTKSVYVKFKDKEGRETPIYNDTIELKVIDSMDVSFQINQGSKETLSRYVSLSIKYSLGVDSMIISNQSGSFSENDQQEVRSSTTWILASGEGNKTVYIQFKDAAGKTKVVSQKITYREPGHYLPEGSLLKGEGTTIYYYGFDGRLHPFVNSYIFHSWYKDFSQITQVSPTKLKQYEVGQPVCVRPGTWLVKIQGVPRVYAVEPGCQLRPLLSEGEAVILYGQNWGKRVLELNPAVLSYYKMRDYGIADVENKVTDQDRDGVDLDVESDYQTSDRSSDTDNDGLSVYEEIFYWFSDPNKADTDGDRYDDGEELVNGYAPNGPKLTAIPAETYSYPYGTVFQASNGNFYYCKNDGKFYALGSTKKTSLLSSNGFNENFIVHSPYVIPFKAESKSVSKAEMAIVYPTFYLNGQLTRM